MLTREELTELARLAVEHDLLVISDEVYEHLTFGVEHIPIASLPGMRDRTVTIGSGGKSFSMTGWKVGWVTACPELVTAVRTAKQFLTYVSAGPFQPAIAVGLRLPDSYFLELAADLQVKRDRICAGLAEAGLGVYEPKGTYFVLTDIRPLGETDGLAFCRSLPERCGLVAIPCSVFYDDKEAGRSLVRFAFCKRHEVLDDARCPEAEGPAPRGRRGRATREEVGPPIRAHATRARWSEGVDDRGSGRDHRERVAGAHRGRRHRSPRTTSW